MRSEIYDNPYLEIVFSTKNAVLCSFLVDGTLAKKWKRWKKYFIELREDGTVAIRKTQKPQSRIKRLFRLEGSVISALNVNKPHKNKGQRNTKKKCKSETGLLFSCKDSEFEVRFRCVLSESEAETLLSIVKAQICDCQIRPVGTSHILGSTATLTTNNITPHSAMRNAVATDIMDSLDEETRKRRIISRRGALRWLPVLFSNDLVHGSWLAQLDSRSCLSFLSK